jgi:hypothetical protein
VVLVILLLLLLAATLQAVAHGSGSWGCCCGVCLVIGFPPLPPVICCSAPHCGCACSLPHHPVVVCLCVVIVPVPSPVIPGVLPLFVIVFLLPILNPVFWWCLIISSLASSPVIVFPIPAMHSLVFHHSAIHPARNGPPVVWGVLGWIKHL